jgi:hypothetical protein
MKRTVEIKKMDDGEDLYFELSPEDMEILGWVTGDTLVWESNNDGSWTISKKDDVK